jgi:hypothetical protein
MATAKRLPGTNPNGLARSWEHGIHPLVTALGFIVKEEEYMSCPVKNRFVGIISFLIMSLAVAAQADDNNDRKRFNVELEGGPVWQSQNDVRIPGDSGTEFSFKDLTGSGPYAAGRFSFGWNIRQRHALRFVAAPLRVTGSGTFDQPVSFAGKTFAAGISTDGSYKFDTYRLTYRYMFLNKKDWRLQAGGTLLLRDAEIELEQNGVNASDSNVGVVPLLSLAAEYAFTDRWTAIFDFDGLAGGPGRAFDVAIKLQYDVTERWYAGAGYRLLEGGADNDSVYSFAWFNFAFFSVGYRF